MVHGNGFDDQLLVFVDAFWLVRIQRVEDDFERNMAEEINDLPHVRFEIRRHVEMQRGDASHEAHGGEEAWQAEAVVAVAMGDEDMVELAEFQLIRLKEKDLRGLATVQHEELFMDVQDLRGREMARCGEGGAAA